MMLKALTIFYASDVRIVLRMRYEVLLLIYYHLLYRVERVRFRLRSIHLAARATFWILVTHFCAVLWPN